MPQSPSSSSTKSKPDAAVVKHRACDECRTRKLACSKELDGCGRCRKEGWKCVYSPQKPMGRPRKRRHVDEADEQQASFSGSAAPVPHQSLLPPADPVAAAASASSSASPQFQYTTLTPGHPLDIDYSTFYDAGDYGGNMGSAADMPYYDFFSPANGLPQAVAGLDYPDFSMGYTEPAFPASSGLQFGGVDLLGGINFDEKDPANKQLSEDINNAAKDIVALHAQFEERKAREALEAQQRKEKQQQQQDQNQLENPLSADSPPNLSPPPTNPPSSTNTTTSPAAASSSLSSASQPPTPKDAPTSLKPLPDATCGCLSQVYLALDSLTRLPDDIIEAMKVARNAAKSAHDVIVCPVCSQPYQDDVTLTPTMQSFQNTMLLGTLIPTTANAYVRILEMIETTTAAAKEKNEDIMFRLNEYGGFWGGLAYIDKITCQTERNYNDRLMKPDHWRLTIRALLKLDVYGFQVERSSVVDGSHISHRHLGLRDVIQAMEERSTRRHDLIDAMVASGQPHPLRDGHFGLMQGQPTKDNKDERHCMKIVEMARIALDKLVIA